VTEQYVKPEYPLSAVTARIIAAAHEVHRELDDALGIEHAGLRLQGL
jgi:hypothetical protein